MPAATIARSAEMQREIITRIRATLAEAVVPKTNETETHGNVLRNHGRNAMFGGVIDIKPPPAMQPPHPLPSHCAPE